MPIVNAPNLSHNTLDQRQDCQKILPYVLGGVLFLVVAFGIYVRSLPKRPSIKPPPATSAGSASRGMTFEEAMSADMGSRAAAAAAGGGSGGGDAPPEPEAVINLDGDGL